VKKFIQKKQMLDFKMVVMTWQELEGALCLARPFTCALLPGRRLCTGFTTHATIFIFNTQKIQ